MLTKVITLSSMRNALVRKFPELLPLSLTTVRSILRDKLHYSYKRANKKPLHANSQYLRQHCSEAVQIQIALIILQYMIIYIDEFNISENSFKPSTWVRKGEEALVYTQSRRKSLHCIIGTSLNKIIKLSIQDRAFR